MSSALLTLVALASLWQTAGAVDDLWGAVSEQQDTVGLFGEGQASWGSALGSSSGTPATVTARSSEGASSPLTDCIPRTRTLDGVAHQGWACVDGTDGELVWVPAGEDAAGAAEPPGEPLVITREDVQSLLVDSGSVVIQPDRSWVLVNAETIAFTDAAEHVLTTQVLGLDVELRVVPAQFTWDFGDGSAPLAGTDPGAPWPDHTVAHVYSAAGDAQVTLRTEWDAHFRLEGTSSWLAVTGRPVTVASSDPFEVVTAIPRLTN